MNSIVCVKQVPDPETPPANFRIDPATNKVVPVPGVPPVISPFDEQAVEAALRLKDTHGGKVTVISMGMNLVMDVVKKPLSMGADELFLLQDQALEEGDAFSTARALAAAIKKIGGFDLIFCGRQAADWDQGLVGQGIAEILGLPCITVARKVEAKDNRVTVERVAEDGYEVVEAQTPAVITVSNELGQARYPTMRGIMAAGRKKPTTWSLQDLGIPPTEVGKQGARTKLQKLFIPLREVKCDIVSADSPAEAGAALALKLREAKII